MTSIQTFARLAVAHALLSVCMTASSQTPSHSVHATFNSPTDSVSGSSSAVSSVATKPAPPQHALTERWLDLTTLSHAERFRSAIAEGGPHVFQNAQARTLVEGKFKIDPAARLQIGFRASSGRYFNWAFSNYTGDSFIKRVTAPNANLFTPAESLEITKSVFADPEGLMLLSKGIQSNGWEFYMRELYLSATPVKPVMVEFGSMGVERGYSTEITTFDEDSWISGERIRLRDKKHLFFDEVSFTNAYFGDYATPNFFARAGSLKESNYRQVAAKRKLNDKLAFSGEYTWQTDISTLREAVVVRTKPLRIIDSARLEVYERVNAKSLPGLANSPIGPIDALSVPGGAGFALTVEKKAGRVSGDFGFASVDKDYAIYADRRFMHAVSFAFNGDTYGIGHRIFLHTSIRLTPAVSAFGFYTHEIGSERFSTLNLEGVNAGLNFNLKALVNSRKAIF